LGYKAAAAYGGRDGLNRFDEGAFQLVITDLKMPKMDGLELLESVKALDRCIVIIVIAGYGAIESAVRPSRRGHTISLPSHSRWRYWR
jgi:DNA-binding NtrC family response regulator